MTISPKLFRWRPRKQGSDTLQHGAKSFHSAKSDVPDLAKFGAVFRFFPARQGGLLSRKKAPHCGAFVVSGLAGAYRRVLAP
ncbi:hypothetical protein E4K66_16375 [Bradyrhizobium frederickii]|uniref:Uncharacterized protein n=1 Tax=Bradyrhizobium frederickii TaxID=2560054 RepID=A0A4Y9L349_9BRAD|nr:hypothetical protein [Bradyrhizobium frederickii]TFV38010.1 hypothetical protein E4K66_16375 [Bradyrhizobium frederickii]